MCGICGVLGTFQGNGRVFKSLLKGIEYRGMEATGVVWKIIDTDKIKYFKAPIAANDFLKVKLTISRSTTTDILLGHTRNSTSGDSRINAENHPHFYGDWIVMHNGVIVNVDALYRKCRIIKKLECDSAVIPIVFQKFGFKKGLSLLSGWFSISAMNIKKPKNVYLAKNGTDFATIFLGKVKRGIIFSSCLEDIKRYTKDFYKMKRNSWKIYCGNKQISKGKFIPKYRKPKIIDRALIDRTLGDTVNWYHDYLRWGCCDERFEEDV